MGEQPLKIYGLRTENFKKLEATEVELNGKSVTITGKNGVGKSTFIDAVYSALTGKGIPSQPVTKGKTGAKTEVVVGNGDEKYIVTRTYNAEGKGTVKVRTESGASYPAPQDMLNKLLGKISFDVFGFSQSKPAEKRAFLLDLLGIDLTDIDRRKKDALALLLDASNRLKAAKEEQLNLQQKYPLPDTEIKPVDEEPIRQELLTIDEKQKQKERLKAAWGKVFREAESADADYVEAQEKIEEYENKLAEWKQKAADRKERMDWLDGEEQKARKLHDDYEVPSSAELMQTLQNAEVANRNVRLKAAHQAAQKKIDDIMKDGLEKKKKSQAIDAEKMEILTSANMPVPGLQITDDGVLFNGLELSEDQMSTAEIIKVGVGIQMALNPNLRLIRIKDGSLLDSETMEAIKEICAENDYQMFVEVVTNDKEIGFIIEEE